LVLALTVEVLMEILLLVEVVLFLMASQQLVVAAETAEKVAEIQT
jgi:hypothetical protein